MFNKPTLGSWPIGTWKRQLDAASDGLHDLEVSGGSVEQAGGVDDQNILVWNIVSTKENYWVASKIYYQMLACPKAVFLNLY